MESQFTYLGLIVLFPLLGAIINGLVGSRLNRKLVGWIGSGSILLSFFYSLASTLYLYNQGHDSEYGDLTYTAFQWIYAGDLGLDIAFLMDPLTSVMVLVITGVGFLIHVYSIGYMEDDPGTWRYFAYLNLFCFAMLMLVLGKNMLVTFIGWEGVGLCSYLLIGFWYQDDANAIAGQKAFIVNRVGDFAFLAGLFLLYYQTGTFDYVALEQMASTPEGITAMAPVALPAALLIFVGCTGKSAQIPLYTWLPDAMAGPTPVSALIHAATMVTAGVFLISRTHFLFTIDPAIGLTIATIGTLTAFFAATIAVVQNDIKKVLAYSTISQLGYMFMAVGVGAFTAGIFHLMTHAFFKALLFLGSGSVIHAMGGDQNIQNMGGLRKWMPITAITFLVACLAISGFPLLSGFFSKDLILWSALSNAHVLSIPGLFEGTVPAAALTVEQAQPLVAGGPVDVTTTSAAFHWFFYIGGLATAGLTAFYMFRLYFLTFEGECRADEETKSHLHEAPASMTVPLSALGILSVIGGWIGWPHFVPKGWLGSGHKGGHGGGHGGEHAAEAGWTIQDVMLGFEHWLDEVFVVSDTFRIVGRFGAHPYSAEMICTAASVVVGLSGIAAAWWVYLKNPGLPKEIADSVEGLYDLLDHAYWVDELYDSLFVQGAIKVGSFFHAFDKIVIDGVLVDGLGWLAEQAGRILSYLQSGDVQRYATYIVVAIVLIVLTILTI
jgi:NADH-quinone oxidoreductase subunit L